MKSHQFSSFKTILTSLLFIFAVFTACEEMPPYISFNDSKPINTSCEDKRNLEESEFFKTNTNFVSSEMREAQCKMVLMEEFSGVRCVRCPEGHQTVADILEARPNEAAAVTMHAGFLSEPYPENKENYVLDEGVFLYEFFQGIALPAAAIDRVQFEEEDYVAIVNRNVWTGKVNERLNFPPPINVYIHHDFNPSTRELQVFVQTYYLEDFDETANHSLSVSLTESNIIDYQLIPKGESSSEIQADYQHNHVFRGMLTPNLGIVLEVDKSKGMVVERTFSTVLPSHWKPENMEIVAFVHDAKSSHVLQAAKRHF